MTTNYPGAVTNLADVDASLSLAANNHGALHQDANDTIDAITAELGVTPSGSYATVVARLVAIEASVAALTGLLARMTAAETAIDAVGDIVNDIPTIYASEADLLAHAAATTNVHAAARYRQWTDPDALTLGTIYRAANDPGSYGITVVDGDDWVDKP